jgi:AcrR family transcriptional regulator
MDLALKRTFVLYKHHDMRNPDARQALVKTPAQRKTGSTRLQVKGERTRQTILEAAVDIASVAGLEGLTIGQLATKLSMSKSGLFAHFGSKEELQLATVEAARSVFIREVIEPSFAAERGLARLWQLCDAWFAYVSSKVFRGGCFFAAAAAEFDSRPGPVRDRIAAIMKEWLSILARLIADAQAAGQFDQEIEPQQLAFEINAVELAANWAFQLFHDRHAFDRARIATLERLRRFATPRGLVGLPAKPGKRPTRTQPRTQSQTKAPARTKSSSTKRKRQDITH